MFGFTTWEKIDNCEKYVREKIDICNTRENNYFKEMPINTAGEL